MKVFVVGSGGREHALVWKLSRSPQIKQLWCAPGNAGTAQLAQNVAIAPEAIEDLFQFASFNQIDLTLVGPEAPLVAGIVDRFEEAHQPIVGPSRQAALLEGSKVFAKNFMKRRGIPTAAYEVFDQPEQAETALRNNTFGYPVVLKADGLAAGKGVVICQDLEESLQAIHAIMRQRQFGASGDRLVAEEFLEGKEASFMVFSDGKNVIPMIPSRDYKAIYEGDRGPNTGGMGAYSVDEILSESLYREIFERIICPTVEGMSTEGRPFRGVLYAGLMLTQQGPQVLEFNVRFGDPETQVVLPHMESDLLDPLLGIAHGNLLDITVDWNRNATVCVVIASGGYPAIYKKGGEITGLDMASEVKDTVVFHAGTILRDGKVLTSGGRVLGVTSRAPSLEDAIIQAYEGVNKIHFEGMYYRRDIASKGLEGR